eukprot:SAG31_NODE_1769_length_7312_cov_9.295577_5_plen_431_part_00
MYIRLRSNDVVFVAVIRPDGQWYETGSFGKFDAWIVADGFYNARRRWIALDGRTITLEESQSVARRWGQPVDDEPGDDAATISTGVRRARWRERKIRQLEEVAIQGEASRFVFSWATSKLQRAARRWLWRHRRQRAVLQLQSLQRGRLARKDALQNRAARGIQAGWRGTKMRRIARRALEYKRKYDNWEAQKPRAVIASVLAKRAFAQDEAAARVKIRLKQKMDAKVEAQIKQWRAKKIEVDKVDCDTIRCKPQVGSWHRKRRQGVSKIMDTSRHVTNNTTARSFDNKAPSLPAPPQRALRNIGSVSDRGPRSIAQGAHSMKAHAKLATFRRSTRRAPPALPQRQKMHMLTICGVCKQAWCRCIKVPSALPVYHSMTTREVDSLDALLVETKLMTSAQTELDSNEDASLDNRLVAEHEDALSTFMSTDCR